MPGQAENSMVLASSEGCPRQIMRYGRLIYGFQCHMEITRAGIEAMLAVCPEDLAPSRFTQETHDFLRQDYESINQAMVKILNRLVDLNFCIYDI